MNKKKRKKRISKSSKIRKKKHIKRFKKSYKKRKKKNIKRKKSKKKRKFKKKLKGPKTDKKTVTFAVRLIRVSERFKLLFKFKFDIDKTLLGFFKSASNKFLSVRKAIEA